MNALLTAASAWVSAPEPATGLTPEERTAILSALAGEEAALAELIRLFSLKLYAIAYGILQNSAEAEDVVQEVFYKVHRQRHELRDPDKFSAWLNVITRNTARVKYRQRPPRPVQLSREEEEGMDAFPDGQAAPPDAALTRRERNRQLHAALRRLPEKQRIALTLRYLEGLDHRQIRRVLRVSNGKLRGILARSLATLRRDLSDFFHASETTL